jgi:hypothetical protein
VWDNKVFNGSNICVDPLSHEIRCVNWVIVVEQIHVAVIVMLIDIRQNFLLKKFCIRLSVCALQDVKLSQAVETEALK